MTSSSTDSAQPQDAADVDPFRYDTPIDPDAPPMSGPSGQFDINRGDSTSTPATSDWAPVDPNLQSTPPMDSDLSEDAHVVHVSPDIRGVVTLTDPALRSVPPPYIPQRLHDTLSIVGFADGHRDHAPWHRTDMEFWGINRLHAVLEGKPWTRWFEIHSLEDFYRDDQQHQQWMRDTDIPIYVRPQDMPTAAAWQITTAEPYPIDRILSAFQPGYFNNTISWLLALAIAMGFEEIHLYGVDMAQDHVLQNEYSHQRPSCEWLLGLAQGRGIRLVIPPGSDLLKTSHLYGFDSDTHRDKLAARMKEIADRKEQMRAEMNEYQGRAQWFQSRISELDGSLQELQYHLRNLVTPSVKPPDPPG